MRPNKVKVKAKVAATAAVASAVAVVLMLAPAWSHLAASHARRHAPTPPPPYVRYINRGYLRPVQGPYSYPQLWYSPPPRAAMVPGYPVSAFTPLGTEGAGGYALFTTDVVPYAGAQSVAVAWINQQQASVQIYAGTSQPAGSFPYQGAVPPSRFPSLIAAFEGGFQFSVANGGFYQAGTVGIPLRNGAASLVEYQGGTLDIGTWGSELSMTPQVQTVRQNLYLLVDQGQLNPLVNVDPLVTWGYSLGNLLATWRSGIGITANGNLVWVGGPGLSPADLGNVLIWAGAIRGMQLDINPAWVNFASYTYQPGSGIHGTNLLPAMYFPPSHYLTPFWRDFIAVSLRGG